MSTLNVAWEILPPGERESNIAIILGRKPTSDQTRSDLVERCTFLEAFKPRNLLAGKSGLRRYFGAQYADNVVVFENVEYGNAAHVMGADWETLSQLSRTELLAMARHEFDRIPHVGDWRTALKTAITKRFKY